MFVGTIEAFRQPGDMGAGNALAIVGDRNRNPRSGWPRAAGWRQPDHDPNQACVPSIFYSIVEQVLYNLGQLIVVTCNIWQIRFYLKGKRHAPGVNLRLEYRREPPDQHCQVNAGGRELMLGQLDAGEAQQVIDQPIHPLRLLGHDGEEAALCRRIVGCWATQGVDEANEAGQRRPQLVACIRYEVGTHPLYSAFTRAVRQNCDNPAAVLERGLQWDHCSKHFTGNWDWQAQFCALLLAISERTVDGRAQPGVTEHRAETRAESQFGGSVGALHIARCAKYDQRVR